MISDKDYLDMIRDCRMCPQNCHADRTKSVGKCLCGEDMIISKIMFHQWEEPAFCYGKGVGAIFFAGCPMHCIFCQNIKISRKPSGTTYSISKLANKILELQEDGASAIDLVTPTHFSYQIIKSLEMIKHKLNIPVVWNCGGYESTDTIEMLSGLVDIYLPDFKFFYPETAKNYCGLWDYPDICKQAIDKMINQTKNLIFDGNHLKKGVIIRHLVLPSHRKESCEMIEYLSKKYNKNQLLISLMSQYVPIVKTNFKELNRRITTYEYKKVCETLGNTSFDGFEQDISAAKKDYIPDF